MDASHLSRSGESVLALAELAQGWDKIAEGQRKIRQVFIGPRGGEAPVDASRPLVQRRGPLHAGRGRSVDFRNR